MGGVSIIDFEEPLAVEEPGEWRGYKFLRKNDDFSQNTAHTTSTGTASRTTGTTGTTSASSNSSNSSAPCLGHDFSREATISIEKLRFCSSKQGLKGSKKVWKIGKVFKQIAY